METLEAVFGSEWLHEQPKIPARTPLTGDPRRHPVAVSIARPDRSSAFELIELAVYLRSCAALPGFGELVKVLRVPKQFTTARMQLALAHRIHLAGATDIEFEPMADRGRRADLYFRYAGRAHLVECYEPVTARNMNYEDLLNAGASRILSAARSTGRHIVVRVDLHCELESFDGQLRKRVENEGRKLISRLYGPRIRDSKTLNDFDIEVFDVRGADAAKVARFAESLGEPGAWIIAHGLIDKRDVPRIPRGENPDIERTGWFVVNSKPRDIGASISRIADTIEGKICQVRRCTEDVLGIMVAITEFAVMASTFQAEAWPLVQALRAKVLGPHVALAGAMLLDHGFHSEHGPFIGGLYLEGREGAHLNELHTAIASREDAQRVIDDWA
ncbi:MAG TPA: hypothetical protein VGD37_00405 [Kofleriaceae bacterium]